MATHQGTGKTLAPYPKLQGRKEIAGSGQTTLDKFYKEIEQFNSQCF